nr:PAS domain-containing protein [Microvirga massiliensis]
MLPGPSLVSDRPQKLCLVGTIQAHSLNDHYPAGMKTDKARLEAILNTMPQMVWSARPDGHHDYYNDRWYEFTGVPYGSTDGEAWSGVFHPDDRPRAWERWRQSLATGEPYDVEYRLRRHDGVYRWTLGRALPIRCANGTVERWFGTCTEIHDLKASEEQRDLISRELAHRIKNIFAVVSSLVSLTSRKDEAVRPFATGLVQRLNSLAHVHEYIQPHSPWNEADPASRTVLGLLRILVSPYMPEPGGRASSGDPLDNARLAIGGDDAPVGAGAGTALALIIHEFATNAVKYGSLSRPEGSVAITGEILPGHRFRLTWQERGGPALPGPPAHQGFGTLLASRSATGQLGAVIEQDWATEGLTVRLTMPLENLEL